MQIHVVGHWEGEQFVDGYWREESNAGQEWNDGYYEDTGTYVEGGWVIVDEDGTELIMVADPVGVVDEAFEAEPIQDLDTAIPVDPETMPLDE
jgi:hypothetical protein